MRRLLCSCLLMLVTDYAAATAVCTANYCIGTMTQFTTYAGDATLYLNFNFQEQASIVTACDATVGSASPNDIVVVRLAPSYPRFVEVHAELLAAAALKAPIVVYFNNTPGQPCTPSRIDTAY